MRPADADTPSFAYSYRRGACAAKPPSLRFRWTVAPGQVQMLFERRLGSGAHCVRVWAADRLGRLSNAAATLQLNVKQ